MNSSGKRIPAGWSFLGGMLLGALAVLGLTGATTWAGQGWRIGKPETAAEAAACQSSSTAEACPSGETLNESSATDSRKSSY